MITLHVIVWIIYNRYTVLRHAEQSDLKRVPQYFSLVNKCNVKYDWNKQFIATSLKGMAGLCSLFPSALGWEYAEQNQTLYKYVR